MKEIVSLALLFNVTKGNFFFCSKKKKGNFFFELSNVLCFNCLHVEVRAENTEFFIFRENTGKRSK